MIHGAGDPEASLLTRKDIDHVIAAYMGRYARYGIDVATLKSGGAAKQFVRHSVHAGFFDLNDKDVLDVGCGIGMFYEFLKASGVTPRSYTGIDIIEAFLESNRRRFPEARFEMLDVLNGPVEQFSPDVVCMSQVFNNKYPDADNEQVAREAMRRLFDIARLGVVVDFMTSYVDFNEAELHYFAPETMFSFAKSLTRFVTLRHDYLPFEFSLCLRRQAAYDPDAVESDLRGRG